MYDVEKKNPETPKKLYSAPVLRTYGTMQELTRTSSTAGGTIDTRGPAMDLKTH
jgi:hypothetical protein